MTKITVRIDSSRPVFIEADADSFGQVFAAMSSEEQVHVFRAMVEHMKPHPIQWDYIAFEIEKDEKREVRDRLLQLLPGTDIPMMAAASEMLDALRIAVEAMEWVDGENDCSKAIRSCEKAIAKAEGRA